MKNTSKIISAICHEIKSKKTHMAIKVLVSSLSK